MTQPNDRFLRACRQQKVDTTPVWFMRQAGRYLTEYRAVREKAGGFLALCKTPELACEVTLQPVDILGVDAAILFSDILIPLEAMGIPISFGEGEGPKLETVRNGSDLDKLHVPDPVSQTGFVMEAIRIIRRELHDRVPLVGFAGAPFTLASYAVEGGTSRTFGEILSWMYREPESFQRLLGLMADTVILYLKAQVEAGAQAIQLFDTWAGVLSRHHYREFVLPVTSRVFSALKGLGVPMILYVNGSAQFLEEMALSGADVISVDWRVGLDEARERTHGACALQGNLDPVALYASKEVLREQARRVIALAPQAGHIFNLGHGMLPDTPRENVIALVEMVHELGKKEL
ncbi:MAG: uroporphyrinogen decarboxylase [Acidobacteria bacterium]|nr:uroporphyrinogen decarboxylase [Acidobacteriota bacterium]